MKHVELQLKRMLLFVHGIALWGAKLLNVVLIYTESLKSSALTHS